MNPRMTWEQAVESLRRRPDQIALIRACYYDDPAIEAARRFSNSEEWRAVQKLVAGRMGDALDVGAGRGIGSYSLARDGWRVTALEPDPSSVVGCGAIRNLVAEACLPIQVVQSYAEVLPFGDSTFDLVYGRAVFHHAHDLNTFCNEIARVLKPGGRFIFTREHVLNSPGELEYFLSQHPLHHLYGGEYAYVLDAYTRALQDSGLVPVHVLGPYDSPINYFPMTYDDWRGSCCKPLFRYLGYRLSLSIASDGHLFGRWLLRQLASRWSAATRTPGRLYSFVGGKKP